VLLDQLPLIGCLAHREIARDEDVELIVALRRRQ
jgi:hypothetical protein